MSIGQSIMYATYEPQRPFEPGTIKAICYDGAIGTYYQIETEFGLIIERGVRGVRK